jgi:hypothetical protein
MPLENRLFTGRDDLLAAMHAALSAADDAEALRAAALTQAALTTRRSRSGNRSTAIPELCANRSARMPTGGSGVNVPLSLRKLNYCARGSSTQKAIVIQIGLPICEQK